ncbi:MAG TPA: MBL fold metallo-hydrolase, partial [Vicinamibacteria bacterium]|nr:MBL fold metallo-hydrolase [Vicinamibacteria bacterium]
MKSNGASGRSSPVEFEIWGARGSRSLSPPISSIANYTSCYSVRAGADLFVLDGGRGLGVLSRSLSAETRFRGIERVHLLLSHSHMDHWEGLKDAEWFWTNGNGLELFILGAEEALETVRRGYGHPAYVPLEVLASQTLRRLSFSTLQVDETRRIRRWKLETFALNHYSGGGRSKNRLETLGYRLRSPQGFVIAYLCDHEPSPATEHDENRMLEGAHLALIDAHFADRVQHAYGHGSQEHAASLAKRHPRTLVLAAHHGPTHDDRDIRSAHARHGKDLANYAVAAEGMRLTWN